METSENKVVSTKKVVLVGESGVGKTSMLTMICKGKMNSKYIPTIGVDFAKKSLDLDENKVQLQIWDAAGSKKYKPPAKVYYKGALGAILVYAINNRNSFEALEDRAKEVSSHGVPVVFLIGNKIDDASNRVVETAEGQKFADDHKMKFFEISTQNFNSVMNIFSDFAKEIMKPQPSKNTAKTERVKNKNNENPMIKVLLVGESGVGKSSVLSMFCKGEMNSKHVPTIGIDFAEKALELDEKKVQLQIWDPSGLEKFKNIYKPYYKEMRAAVLIYAVDDRSSFDALEDRFEEISNNKVPIVFLIGNKIDDEANRAVGTLEGQKFADDHNLSFFEISTKHCSSVKNVFLELLREIMKSQRFIVNMERED